MEPNVSEAIAEAKEIGRIPTLVLLDKEKNKIDSFTNINEIEIRENGVYVLKCGEWIKVPDFYIGELVLN